MKEETKFRVVVTIVGIFIPPLAVLMLYGFGRDFLLNCLLMVCGFFPSTIHQICLDSSYWSRRKKVRQERYPGDKHSWIFSKDSQSGGASDKELARLRANGQTKKEAKADEKKAKKEPKAAPKHGRRAVKAPERSHSRNNSQPHRRSSLGDTPRRSRSQYRHSEMDGAQARGRSQAHDTMSRPVSQHRPRTPEHAQHGHSYDQRPYRYDVSRQSGTYDPNEIYNNPRFSDVYDPNGIYGPPGSIYRAEPNFPRNA